MNIIQELQHISLATTYEIDDSFDSDRFIKLRLRVSHDGDNPNKSSFSVDAMEDAIESIKNTPLLANVIFDEDQQPQFSGHDMHIEDDKVNEGEKRLIYDETPIGVIPESCNYEIKEYNGKNYTFCDCYCWKGYSNYAQDIIERDKDIKLSMEISVLEYNFNAKNKVYNITKYKHTGITLLNKNFGTGMENALATTGTFSENNPNTKLKFIEMMEDLKETLVQYNNEKGGMDNVTKPESKRKPKEFEAEIEPIADKIDEVVEVLEESETIESAEPEVTESEVVEETAETIVEEPEVPTEEFQAESPEKSKEEKFTKSFELSHSDIRYGLYQLLSPVENEDNECYVIDQVYDDKFEYVGWFNGKIFRQFYSKKGDDLSFVGERIEVFQERLTIQEKEQLNKMRSDFSLLSADYEKVKTELESLNSYKLEKERVEKELIFSKFEGLTEEDLKDIKENMDSYSLDQLEERLLLTWAKKRMEFEKIKKENGKDEDVKDKLIFALATNETVSDKNAPIYADIVSKHVK